uniref:Uncharacterized protein n=1 Tax=Rhizophora mucronata TaxID=61149 RepID=A0A2P2PRT7_RHIMU
MLPSHHYWTNFTGNQLMLNRAIRCRRSLAKSLN